MQNKISDDLGIFFEREKEVSVAYLFGSRARKIHTAKSDIDVAVLLSEPPERLLDYYLYLLNELSKIVGDDLDLIILNNSPPILRYQVIKYGRIVFSRSERIRIEFEARAQSEYLDFKIALERYDECLLKSIIV